MKKRLLALVVCVLVMMYPLAVFGLGDNPPQVPTEPDIVAVTLSSDSHVEGLVKSVTVTVDTSNISDGTAITAQLVQSDGSNSVAGVSIATGTVSENVAALILSIPTGIAAGAYKVKVNISSLNIFDSSTTYTITAGAQKKITSVSASTSSHVTGNLQSVNVEVITENVGNGTSVSVELVDGNGKVVTGVIAAVGTINSNNAFLTLTIPASIPAGSYKLKVTAGTATNDSTVYTIIANSSDPAILSVSLNSSTQYTGTSRTVTVTANTQLVSDGVDVTVSLVNAEGTAVEGVDSFTSDVSSNSSSSQLIIPETIAVGSYYVKVQIADPELTHDSTSYRVIQPAPSIDGIVTEGANLYEGSIIGNILISGGNFSSTHANNTIEIVNATSGDVVATVIPLDASVTSLTAEIPDELAAGSYVVRVSVGTKSVTSSMTFEITRLVTATATVVPTVTATPTTVTPTSTQTTGGASNGAGGSGNSDDEVANQPTPTPIVITPGLLTTIDKVEVENKIAKIVDRQTRVIEFNLSESATGNKLLLDTEAVDLIIQEKVDIAVASGEVKVEIPVIVMTPYTGYQLEVNLTLVDESVLETIPAKSMNNLILSGPAYEIQLLSISDTIQTPVTRFKAPVKIELSTKGIDITRVNTKKLAIYYFDETEMEWEFIGGKYDVATGKVTAKTKHFTKFAVMEYNKSFADVSSSSWAKDYIELLAARNITDGVDENNFDPKGEVTRAQFTTFLVKALGIETSDYTGKFSDIPDGKWYSLHVEAAEKSGLVSGLGGGLFEPNTNITREQMAVMVMNAYKYTKGTNIAEEAKKVKAKFMDENTFNSWGKDAVYAAKANGIIDGMPGNIYSPKEKATREQSARVIIGLLELLGEI